MDISECDIQYVPRESIKSLTLADFIAEFSSHADKEMPLECELLVDGALNVKGSVAGIIFKGPGDILI